MNSISNDISSMIVNRFAAMNRLALANSLAKLATGSRINTAADDPAGLIASQDLSSTLAQLDAEARINQRAEHQTAVADGALGQVSNLLTEAKTLALANANQAALSPEEKAANQLQLDSALSSVDRIASRTSFLGTKLLDGSATISAVGQALPVSSVATTHLGTTEVDGHTYQLSDLKSGGSLSIVGGASATTADVLEQAINDVSTLRGRLGAMQKNSIRSQLNSAAITMENTAAALSQIHDTDFAAQTAQLLRAKLLQSSLTATAMFARRSKKNVLALLRPS